MGFIDNVRKKVADHNLRMKETAIKRKLDDEADKAASKIIADKRSEVLRDERIKQAERVARTSVKIEADREIKKLRAMKDPRDRGFEIMGFGGSGNSNYDPLGGSSYSTPKPSKKKQGKVDFIGGGGFL